MSHGLRSSEIKHSPIFKQDLRSFWRGCRCPKCKRAHADYCRDKYRAKNGLTRVPASRSRQLLLQFESVKEAATVTGIPHVTCWRIINGLVKSIKRTTAQQIAQKAA